MPVPVAVDLAFPVGLVSQARWASQAYSVSPVGLVSLIDSWQVGRRASLLMTEWASRLATSQPAVVLQEWQPGQYMERSLQQGQRLELLDHLTSVVTEEPLELVELLVLGVLPVLEEPLALGEPLVVLASELAELALPMLAKSQRLRVVVAATVQQRPLEQLVLVRT